MMYVTKLDFAVAVQCAMCNVQCAISKLCSYAYIATIAIEIAIAIAIFRYSFFIFMKFFTFIYHSFFTL